MKKLFNYLHLLLLPIVGCVLVACSEENEINLNNSNNGSISALSGTKWTTTNWDYGIGDDWVSTLDETYNIYFHSSTEGFLYYGRKDFDSDYGASSERKVAHFKYSVTGSEIILDYITDPIFSCYSMKISGNTLSAGGLTYNKGSINNDDRNWINTLCGNTGSCKWYSNIKNAIWIIGDGAMADYTSYSKTPWYMNSRIPNYVYIVEGVTSVGAYAFANPSVGEVELPSSLTSIGRYAFQSASISEIDFPDDVKVISQAAFGECDYLSTIYMPKNIEIIEKQAFAYCKQASLYDTKKLKTIGEQAFLYCTVTKWTDSQVLENIGYAAFSDCDFTELVLPNSLKQISSNAFVGDRISTIRIGTGLSSVAGTPFFPASRGKMYVDKNVPLNLSNNIIYTDGMDFSDKIKNWTLYVPKGSKSAYSKANYWKNFGSIVEDSGLDGDGTVADEDNTDDNDEDGEESSVSDFYSKSVTYSIGETTYRTIRVEGGQVLPFYIMQTELPANIDFKVGTVYIERLPLTRDCAVGRTAFRKFLLNLREKTGIPFRLPTTEEWMVAASGGNKGVDYTYSGSNNINEVAWYKGNSNKSVHDVATKSPNELSIYDMSGNYAELCNNTNNIDHVDGPLCGGCWKDEAVDCTIRSWKEGERNGKIPGTTVKEKNAFDARYNAIRLVYSAQ